jgi:hypothetical protein
MVTIQEKKKMASKQKAKVTVAKRNPVLQHAWKFCRIPDLGNRKREARNGDRKRSRQDLGD